MTEERLAARKRRLIKARRRHERNPTTRSRELLELRKRQVTAAEAELGIWAPEIRSLGATIENRFGSLGEIERTIGHYTAGPRDQSDDHAFELWRRYHAEHLAQGWGGIGYHFGITSRGTVALLRPPHLKGAHTARANTGSIGIVVHGSPGQRMTAAQRAALTWLIDNAHTDHMPKSHRIGARLRNLPHKVHSDFNPTQCPDTYAADYRAA